MTFEGRTPSSDIPEETRRYLRQLVADLESTIDAVSTPTRLEYEVESTGLLREIRIPHDFSSPPDRFVEINPSSESRVYQSRGDLSDGSFIYLISTGISGTRHIVEVWRTG